MQEQNTTSHLPNHNRARDYVNDVDRWSAHAKSHLAASNFNGALLALAECRMALVKAEAYIKTGQEQYPQQESPEEQEQPSVDDSVKSSPDM